MDLFKFQNDEAKLICIVIVAIAVLAATAVVAINFYCAVMDSVAIKAGYTRDSLPGQQGVYWVKK